jgi:hypothetical protein
MFGNQSIDQRENIDRHFCPSNGSESLPVLSITTASMLFAGRPEASGDFDFTSIGTPARTAV